MKARATNFLIGAATLAVIAVGFAGFLGFRKIHGIQRSPLRIVFEGSAAGLRKGGSVNFDGVQIGEVTSVRLDGPRRIVALTMVDNSAPIREDTAVGLEAQGLTGLMAISLIGGAPGAPAMPRDKDGVPTLEADLSEAQSIRDTLHNIDHVLVDNRDTIRNALQSFETYTGALADEGDEIDGIMRKADTAFASFNNTMARIDDAVPDLTKGKDGELYQKVQSLHELAESFKKRSAAFMEDGRRTLQDVSDGANAMSQKLTPARR
ncbi:MlaD family protein [Bradyrhizobium sp. dw_78]|uniref:MlaD family protein n=1 Tax=Bradyrhizobium sp. dw_78 TaxID=2719793 RepID=UPI001BD5BC78|nr:MlaD family protein [Bradyrhizobium sp. dw_78]